MILSASQRRAAAALGDTFFPSIEEGDPPGGEVVPDALEEFLSKVGPDTRKQLGMAIQLFDLGAVPLHGRRFSALDPERRRQYVESSIDSRIALRRTLYKALREVCGLVYYQDARTWSYLGYQVPKATEAKS